MRQGLLRSQNAGTKLGQAPVLVQLAEVYWHTGQTAAGLQALTDALAVMDTTGSPLPFHRLHRLVEASDAGREGTENFEGHGGVLQHNLPEVFWAQR